MQSTLKPKPADDPHDVIAVASDTARVVPVVEELSNLLRAAARHSASQTSIEPGLGAAPPVPPVDTTFRAAAVNDVRNNAGIAGSRGSIGRGLARAFIALLFATCVGVFGFVWRSYGDAVTEMIAKSAPQFLSSLLPTEKPASSAQAAAPAVVADSASEDAAPPQPAPPQPAPPQQPAAPQPAAPEQAAADSAAPAAAASSPDQGQLLQSMARDIAGLGQQVEQLKASIEELKAGQQQISHDVARASEQNTRPKLSALPPPPRPAAARPRRPMSPLPPPQAAMAPPLPQAVPPYVPPPTTAPYVPRQSDYVPPPTQGTAEPPDEASSSVPRPPMPVR
jgi:hypothetical protein